MNIQNDEIKIVFSDLDGTIVDEHNRITSATQEMIRRLKEKNIQFIPCTGRSYLDMRSCFPKELKFPSVLMNGALFLDSNGKLIMGCQFTEEKLSEIVRNLKVMDAVIVLYTSSCAYLSGSIEQYRLVTEKFFNNENDFIAGEIYMLDSLIELREAIRKIDVLFLTDEEKNLCRERLNAVGGCAVSSSLECNLEITPLGVNKAIMIQKVLDYYQLTEENALMFGDSLNDLEMFQNFRNCVAMENSCDEVMKIAAYKTGSCENDGVAAFVRKLQLI